MRLPVGHANEIPTRVRMLHDGPAVVDAEVAPERCDACDAELPDGAVGRGMLLWRRGDEERIEEPALCEPCACAIGLAALAHWEHEEDGGE